MRFSMFSAAGLVLGLSLFAGGCQHDRNAAIPPTATIAAEGDGGLVTYRAGTDGTAYVFNRNAGKVVYRTFVSRGQLLTINQRKNQVLVDDSIVSEGTLRRGDNYRIFFDPKVEGTRVNAM